MPITRFAPSPTGALHLGNARTFFVNWLLAKQNDWQIVLRIEDLDGPRVHRLAGEQLMDDLHWLGMTWNAGPTYQSTQAEKYRRMVDRLLRSGAAYPCICTRREIDLAASAPHAEDGSAIYPGTCKGHFATIAEATTFAGKAPAIRFHAPDQSIRWRDTFAGPQEYNVAKQLGDFVISKADGTAAYQLAVVVDDATARITHVVRGDDLIDSTPRQIALYHALGMTDQIPTYCHLPLVVGTDGRRLAKRHGDTRLAFYRGHGVPASRMRALLARWCGINAGDDVSNVGSLVERFNLSALPKYPIIFTEKDDRWLRSEQHG